MPLRSIITLINKGILFALFIDGCFETNAQPDYLDYLGHCNYISHRRDRAIEMMDFSRDIFSRCTAIAEKRRTVGERSASNGNGTDGEMEGKHFSNAYLI